MSNHFYVYALLNPTTGPYKCGRFSFPHQPFYIGKGKGNRYRNSLKDHSNVEKGKILKKLQRQGTPAISLIKVRNLTQEKAFAYEMRFITTIGRLDRSEGPLCNKTDGGQGMSGCILRSWILDLSKDERELYSRKLSASVKKHHANMTEEERRKRSKLIAKGLGLLPEEEMLGLIERRRQGMLAYYDKNRGNSKIFEARIKGTRNFLKTANPKRLAKMNRIRSKASKAWHASLTEVERLQFHQTWSDRRYAFWDRITPEKRKVMLDRVRMAKRIKYWNSIPIRLRELNGLIAKFGLDKTAIRLKVKVWTIKSWVRILRLGKHTYINSPPHSETSSR